MLSLLIQHIYSEDVRKVSTGYYKFPFTDGKLKIYFGPNSQKYFIFSNPIDDLKVNYNFDATRIMTISNEIIVFTSKTLTELSFSVHPIPHGCNSFETIINPEKDSEFSYDPSKKALEQSKVYCILATSPVAYDVSLTKSAGNQNDFEYQDSLLGPSNKINAGETLPITNQTALFFKYTATSNQERNIATIKFTYPSGSTPEPSQTILYDASKLSYFASNSISITLVDNFYSLGEGNYDLKVSSAQTNCYFIKERNYVVFTYWENINCVAEGLNTELKMLGDDKIVALLVNETCFLRINSDSEGKFSVCVLQMKSEYLSSRFTTSSGAYTLYISGKYTTVHVFAFQKGEIEERVNRAKRWKSVGTKPAVYRYIKQRGIDSISVSARTEDSDTSIKYYIHGDSGGYKAYSMTWDKTKNLFDYDIDIDAKTILSIGLIIGIVIAVLVVIAIIVIICICCCCTSVTCCCCCCLGRRSKDSSSSSSSSSSSKKGMEMQQYPPQQYPPQQYPQYQ